MAGNGDLGGDDNLEGGAAAAGGFGSSRRARSEAAPPAKKQRTGFRQFVRECVAELGKVQWPNNRQLWQASAVVVVITLVLGVYIALLDSVLTKVASWLIDQYAAH
ncbi:MAG: preprotein translocase subunit SecE [Gaiellales bacterium]